MKKYLSIALMLVTTIVMAMAVPVMAFDAGTNPGATGWQDITWTGNGASDGEVDEVIVDDDQSPYEGGYLHWVVTSDGGSVAANMTDTIITINDVDVYPVLKFSGGMIHFYTPYYTPDATLSAVAHIDVLTTGGGPWNFNISHGWDGTNDDPPVEPQASLTVTKTAVTEYTRTYNWDIDKSVATENGYTHDGYPKVWLYIDGSGDETATWTVDVDYEGYTDSNYNVSGEITIENTGDVSVNITSVDDILVDTAVPVTLSVTLPYVIAVGETVTGTYSQAVDSPITGTNMATVGTDLENDLGEPITYEGYAAVTWGEPTTEVNKEVTINDVSDLFGTTLLPTVTAPYGYSFTYTYDFAWADYANYGPTADYIYSNTATIVETGQSADAALKVNVQGYLDETAYAMGDPADCFIENGFDNWGWTNPISAGTYTWDLWAGAGQCDTSKGLLVGTVTVVYDGSAIDVTYELNDPTYILDETHVYAGDTMFPVVGKKQVETVAPGKYYIEDPLSGDIYVIAHGVVLIPDPYFGP